MGTRQYNIAIFASGAGTNADNIIKYFANSEITVKVIVSNNRKAGVLKIAESNNIQSIIYSFDLNDKFEKLVDFLKINKIDLIVLAGFLKRIPKEMIRSFPGKIINIHPALLPKYGGKSMYGMKVHEAVLMNNEMESGITIHYVNDKYDEGPIIFQARTDVSRFNSAEEIAHKIHELEYRYYPEVIQKILTKQNI